MERITQSVCKVRKAAKIRNRYNQVPHLTQDTTWESDRNIIKYHKQEPRVSPFQAGDHKAAIKRCESMTNTRQNNKKNMWGIHRADIKFLVHFSPLGFLLFLSF